MRLLILLGVIYMAYKALTSLLGRGGAARPTVSDSDVGEIDDVMVKDPYCDVYFPQRNGIHLTHNGADLYFCSTACRDKYVAAAQNKGTERTK